jgi:hypothetical protein
VRVSQPASALPPRLAVTARARADVRAWRESFTRAFAGRHPSRARHARAMIAEITRCANLTSLRSRPTLARLRDATCPACLAGRDHPEASCTRVSLRTAQRITRELEETQRAMTVTEPGTTPRYRPAVLDEGGPNLAREWELIIPEPPPPTPTPGPYRTRNVTPPQPPTVAGLKRTVLFDGSPPNAGARTAAPRREGNEERRSAPCSPSLAPPRWPGTLGEWPLGKRPQRRDEMLAAGESLRACYPVLRRLSARHLRAIGREWYRAGWTPARIVHALDNRPGGAAHTHETRVRHPARWMRARLDLWRDPATGQPLPPPAVVRDPPAPPRAPQAEAAHRQAERQADAAARLAPDAAGSPAARGAAEARRLMLARGGATAAAVTRHAITRPAGAAW